MSRASVLRHLSNGKCSQGCGRDLVTKTMCAVCAEKLSSRSFKRSQVLISQGKCRTGCGRELATQTYCRECADFIKTESANARKKYSKFGKCGRGCGRDSLPDKKICEECRDSETGRPYGLSGEEIRTRRANQNNACIICNEVPPNDSRGRRGLYIDHNHTIGYVRDLICYGCNSCIGYAKEDPQRLKLVASYIEHHNIHKGTVPFRSRA